MGKQFDVNSADEFDNVMKARREKASKQEMNNNCMSMDTPRVEHTEAANLTLKTLNVMPMDATIKKIMTMRIVAPLTTGRERTHLSIGIELGLSVSEIYDMEQAGIAMLDDFLQKVSTADSVQVFNRDKKVKDAVNKEMGRDK